VSNIIEAGKTRDFTDYSTEQIAMAESRRPIVEAILVKQRRSRSDVEKAAGLIGISRRQLYNIMKAYTENPGIGSLIGAKRGRKAGSRQLDPEIEAIITNAIETKYKDTVRRDLHYVIRQIHSECFMRGLKKPAINTIKSRIRELDDREVAKSRDGYKAARDRFSSINDGFKTPRHILDCVMIDHTIADVIVVDEDSRLSVGRPYMTVAIDIRSRAILALILRLSAPSALTVGLAVHMCSTPKDTLLTNLGIDSDWPMSGIPRTLSFDNGSDFRSEAVRFGCEQNLINLDHRPIANPMMGGIVERAIQTINRETHQLPGTTKGDVVKRRGYKAENHACLTLKELEKYLILFITKQYHERIHTGIKVTPKRAWEEGLAGGEMISPVIRTPKDPRRFLIDFLPFKELGIGRRGFNYKGTYYNDPALESLRLKDGKRKYIVRRDPRSVLRVFAYIDSLNPARYLEIAAVDRTLPDISEEEHEERKKRQRKRAESDVNHHSIHSAHLEAETLVENAQKETKTARKAKARRKQNKRSAKALPTASRDSVVPKPIPKPTRSPKFNEKDLGNFLDDGFDDVDPL